MGYDMQSKLDGSEKGYFRLNIWGMGWMRNCIYQGDPALEPELYRFCSNDGYVIGEALGKKIAAALKKYLADNPIGSKLKADRAPHEEAANQMVEMLKKQLGIREVQGESDEDKVMTKEAAQTIEEFIKYNETQCPYEVW